MKGEPISEREREAERRQGKALGRGKYVLVCVRAARVYATRVPTYSQTHAAYGARKRLEKGRMWSRRRRAGDAARSPSYRYYTRYDGKFALTVSATDFRLAPVGGVPAPTFVREKYRFSKQKKSSVKDTIDFKYIDGRNSNNKKHPKIFQNLQYLLNKIVIQFCNSYASLIGL